MTPTATMTTQEVAKKLMDYCSKGQYMKAVEELYSPDIVSMESTAPPGQSREIKGIDGVKAKNEWFASNHEVHSSKVEGPLVTSSHIALMFKLDATFKPQNKKIHMEEIAVYNVVNGKIVHEEFFYGM